jgi:hypothetical protein
VMLTMLGVSVWPCLTRGAVQIQSVNEPPALANYEDRRIEIPQFDALLGSLQSVTIDLRGTGAFVQTFDEFRGLRRSSSRSQDLNLVLETANDETLISLTQPENGSFHSGGRKSIPVVNASAGAHIEPVTVAGEKTLTSHSDLMQFTGSGFVDLFLSAQAGMIDRLRDERSFREGLWIVGADIRVIYNFSPIPEFSTWLAGGFAVLILALVTASGWNGPRTFRTSAGKPDRGIS